MNVNTSGRSSRQRSGLVTPDSELADEEVDRLAQSDETLGDGERALVHAMCNVSTLMDSFNFEPAQCRVCSLKKKIN